MQNSGIFEQLIRSIDRKGEKLPDYRRCGHNYQYKLQFELLHSQGIIRRQDIFS